MGKKKASSHKFLALAAAAAIAVPAVSPAAVSAKEHSFKDVPARYTEAVAYLTNNGITKGLSPSQFGTNVSISRVDAAIQLAAALGIDPQGTYKNAGFKDVPKRGQWAVNALAEKGIISGKAAGLFGAYDAITRNETARLISLAYKLTIDETVKKTPFTDVNAQWAKYVDALVKSGVTEGKTSSRFGADDHLQRGEWALFLYRLAHPAAKELDLTIMHTNDTHAHIENAARKVTAIKEVRKAKPNNVLLDAGDVFSGTLYFNEYLGQADLNFMNLVGYDAMTFGNHEFDLGTKPLANFIAKAKFPFVSANVNFTSDENIKGLVTGGIAAAPKDGSVYDAIIKEVDGEKVGIFGLTTAETVDISSPGAGVMFEDYLEKSKKTVASLEKQGVNKIIALTHIGFKDGGGDNDVTLAKEVEGIDIIVGGHSHDLLKEPVLDTTGKEPTVIVQANEYNKYLGTLDVKFDKNGKVIGHAGKLIEIDAKGEDGTYILEDDPEAAEILATEYKPAIDAKKKTVVGKTAVALNGERADVRTKETNLGNLITDGMLEKAKTINKEAVIAVQNGGGIRASINEGDITLDEVLTVMPFGNALAIMNLTGAEIRAALENSVKEVPGQFGGFLQVSGLKFTYDSSKPVGERVKTVEVKKENGYVPLVDTESYVVATNTFTAKGGDGYSTFGKAYEEGRVSEPGFVDWEMFRDYIQANPNAAPELENRITDINQP
ncbi:5'-nucleotidase C-terminal domain-containing protein [Pseudobacillus wudalianchiensis]|uniref:Bifunctional metallophosphatase/5'-nucleotidase n=1 Tax=Pseudobacillus wudalianchiensis TaxID=1743143 RepID=A0A1B9AYG3_9BACI|nr:5'-nucleotidase C-terminal domain-containing protein [Bacillus wudalianchiensis]OCA88952.1 bifunctional metallophosphatase/5'-nucleotidase [Bacillus wudalianchiensis]